MGVDEEIQNIYESIYNINITLVNVDQGLGQMIEGMNFGLGIFDQHVNMVVDKVNGFQTNVNSKMTSFPNQWLYLLVLIFVIFLLLALVGYLLFYIIDFLLHRYDRYDEYKLWYLKNVMKINVDEWEEDDEFDDGAGSDVTPPPTYSEYTRGSDLYSNYDDELESQTRPSYFSSRIIRGKGDEYSTLI